MKDRTVIDANELDLDLAALGLTFKEPDQDDIHTLLWGVPKGQPIPFEEFNAATVGEDNG
jgi:hypothetical protein